MKESPPSELHSGRSFPDTEVSRINRYKHYPHTAALVDVHSGCFATGRGKQPGCTRCGPFFSRKKHKLRDKLFVTESCVPEHILFSAMAFFDEHLHADLSTFPLLGSIAFAWSVPLSQSSHDLFPGVVQHLPALSSSSPFLFSFRCNLSMELVVS